MINYRFVQFFLILVFSFTTLSSAQSEFKYSYFPKRVFNQQLFPITLTCVSECTRTPPKFSFDTSSNIQPLFVEPMVIRNGKDRFYTFYFKANNQDIQIPSLSVSHDAETITIPSQSIFLKKLPKKENFSGVLAADMKIKNSQVSNYDEHNHLITLSLEAFESNLEDMFLVGVEESGIEQLKRKNAKVEAEFYFVVPVEYKKITFSYYNTIKNLYVAFTVPIELNDDSVSTQSDLNPKKDSFAQLKKYTFIVLVIFFFLMFVGKRDFFYLVLGVVSLITLLTFYIPHKKICIKQGASLYILPTDTSTIGTNIQQKFQTMLLGERGDYLKIEYKKGRIGWIKNEDLCEN